MTQSLIEEKVQELTIASKISRYLAIPEMNEYKQLLRTALTQIQEAERARVVGVLEGMKGKMIKSEKEVDIDITIKLNQISDSVLDEAIKNIQV